MITLKELVKMQELTGEKDGELIVRWYTENNLTTEGMEIMYNLAKQKIDDDEWRYSWLVSDMRLYGATESIIKEFGVKDGTKLDDIIRNYIISKRINENFEEKYPQFVEWLKENIPKHNLPFVFWRDFAEYLESKGIYPKDKRRWGDDSH